MKSKYYILVVQLKTGAFEIVTGWLQKPEYKKNLKN